MKRALAAILIAIPIGWIATGFADHSGWSTSGIAMCLVAPGVFFVLNVPSQVPFLTKSLDTLAAIGLTAFAIDLIYYAVVCYGALTIVFAVTGKSTGRQQSRIPARHWWAERSHRK